MLKTDDYYIWLIKKIDDEDHLVLSNYRMLMEYLYDTEFVWWNELDANRAADGLELRRRYVRETGDDERPVFYRHLGGYCSLLEMMVAMAMRGEREYMSDLDSGKDNSSKWFWEMVKSLDLEDETDGFFDVFFFNQQMNRLFCKDDSLTLFGENIEAKQTQIWNQFMKHLLDVLIKNN